MIPYKSVSVYRLMQLTIPVIAIHFELVGFHGIVFLSFIFYAVEGEGHRQATVQHSLTKDKKSIPYFTGNLNTFRSYAVGFKV